MASLLDKINTLISANLHAMVDKALQQNSVAVMDEYIRQAEDNLDKLEDATATVGGQVKTLKRKYDEYAAQAAKYDRDIDALLQQGREDLATAAQSKYNTTQRMAEEYKEQYERQQAEYQDFAGCQAEAGSQAHHHQARARRNAGAAGPGQVEGTDRQDDEVHRRHRGQRRCRHRAGGRIDPGAARQGFGQERDDVQPPGRSDGRSAGQERTRQPVGRAQEAAGAEQLTFLQARCLPFDVFGGRGRSIGSARPFA